MYILKSLHNLSEELLLLSWHTLYLIKPLLCAWRTAWLASQIHWVSLLETQQSPRMTFFPPSLIYSLGKKELPERAGYALCLQLIAESNFGRAFGNICHLTCQCFLFFIFFILLCYLARQFMPSNTIETQVTFGTVLHPWSNPFISSYLSIYLQVHSFWLQNGLDSFFCPSLKDSARAASPRHGFFPPSFLWLGDLAFVPSWFTKSYSGCSFSVRGLGFYGLISGGFNCSDQEVAREWCFPPWLAETLGLHSCECRKSLWTVKALGSVSNLYSSISLKCHLLYVDCNAAPFCCPFPRSHPMKFVL